MDEQAVLLVNEEVAHQQDMSRNPGQHIAGFISSSAQVLKLTDYSSPSDSVRVFISFSKSLRDVIHNIHQYTSCYNIQYVTVRC